MTYKIKEKKRKQKENACKNHDWLVLEEMKMSELIDNIHNEDIIALEKMVDVPMRGYPDYYDIYWFIRMSLGNKGKYIRQEENHTLQNAICKCCEKKDYRIDLEIKNYKTLVEYTIKYNIDKEKEELDSKHKKYEVKQKINYKNRIIEKYSNPYLEEQIKKRESYVKALKKLDKELGI